MKQFYLSFIRVLFVGLAFVFLFNDANSQNCTVNAGIFREWCTTENIQLFGNLQGLPQAGSLQWSQIGGPTVIIDDPLSETTSITGAQGGNTYQFRLVARCVDGSRVFDDVTYLVNETPTTDAGPNVSGCPGSYFLNASSVETDETGIWTVEGTNNGVSIVDVNDPNTEITLLQGAGGITTLRWTVINDLTGCEAFDEITVTNCGGTSVVDAGPDQVLDECFTLTTSTTLAASSAGFGGPGCGQLGTWSVVSGPNLPTFGNINSPTSSLSNLIEGTYVLRWTVTGTCASGTDLVTIEVPEPVGEVTGAIIVGGSRVFCDGRTQTVLQGNQPQLVNEVVLWECISGPCGSVVFGNPNQPITTVSGLDGTSSYTFRYIISNPVIGCSDSSTARVSYADPPTIDIASDVILPCGETVADVSFTATGGNIVEWRLIDGPDISSPTSWSTVGSSPFSIPGFSPSGTYTLEMRNRSVEGNACTAATDQATIISSGLANLANAGTDQLLACNVFSTELAGNDPLDGGGVGVGTWSQVEGPTDAIIQDPNDEDSPISNLEPGQYTFRWIVTDGLFCPPNQDDVIVRVADTIPFFVDAGPDQTVCYGTPIQLEGNEPGLNEVGVWTVVPEAGVEFTDSTLFNTVVNGLQPNTSYTFTWTIFNGCGSISDEVVIFANNIEGPIQADAGFDFCLPNDTTSITMNANPPGSGTGTWTQVSGPMVTIVDENDPETEISGFSNDTSYFFEWRIETDPFCAATRDTVIVTLSDEITPPDAGMDQTVCGDSVSLNANTPLVGDGMWTQAFGPVGPVIDDPSDPNTAVTNLDFGVAYTFRWTVSLDGCAPLSDDMIVVASQPADSAMVSEDTLGVCGLNSVTLNGNAVSNGIWTTVSGPNIPTISPINAPNATASGLLMGTYRFGWNSRGGEFCPVLRDTVVVEVVPIANAGDSQEYCDSINAVNLVGNTASTGSWSYVAGSGPNVPTLDSTSANSATASGLVSGDPYLFVYSISAGAGDSICQSTDTTSVQLFGDPSPAVAGDDQELCDQDSFFLSATPPVIGVGEWSVVTTNPAGLSGNFVDPDSPETIFENAEPGVYILQWTVVNDGCGASNGDQITIDNWVAPDTADAGPDILQVCDNQVTLMGNDPVNGVGNWTLIDQPGGADAEILNPILFNTTVIDMDEPGEYTFVWTISSGDTICPPTSDTMVVQIEQIPDPALAGDDQFVCDSFEVQLDAAPIDTGIGEWFVVFSLANPDFADPSDPKTIVSDLDYGTHIFEWVTTEGNCVFRDTMTIFVSRPTQVPDLSSTSNLICQFDPLFLIAAPLTSCFDLSATDPFSNIATASGSNFSDSTVIVSDMVDLVAQESPEVVIDKRLMNTVFHIDGSVSISFEFEIINSGNVPINLVSLSDDLSTAFSPCDSIEVVSLFSSNLLINSDFDGVSDVQLLDTIQMLNPGVQETIDLTIRIFDNGCDLLNNSPYTNLASLSAGSINTIDSIIVDLVEMPELLLEKREISTVEVADTVVTISYEFILTNSGNADIDSLNLTDDLEAAFAPCDSIVVDDLSSPFFSVNANFDGKMDTQLLVSGQSINADDQQSVFLTITIYDDGCDFDSIRPFTNVANLTGVSPSDSIMMATDTVDTEGVEMPGIAFTKSETSTVFNLDGSVSISFDFLLENTGNVDLDSLSLTDDLLSAFSPCDSFEIISFTSTGLVINGDYDGDSNTEMLVAGQSLGAGDQQTVNLTIRIYDNNCDLIGNSPYTNSATFSGMPTSDTTLFGSDGASINLEEMPMLDLMKQEISTIENIDGSVSISYKFILTNSGNSDLTNISLTDNLAEAFQSCELFEIDTLFSPYFLTNGSFDGILNTEMLEAGQTLISGDQQSVFLTVNLYDLAIGTWSFLSGPTMPFIIDPTNNTTQVIGTIPGTYTFRFTSSSQGCPDEFDDVMIQIDEQPNLAQIFITNLVGCAPDPGDSLVLNLSANSPSGSEIGTWENVDGNPAELEFDDANDPNTNVGGFTVVGSPAIYSLRWVLSIGDCFEEDTRQIHVWEQPSESNAGSNDTLCGASSFTLIGNDPDVGEGTWLRISGPSGITITDPTSNTTTVTGVNPNVEAEWEFAWIISNGPACDQNSDTVSILNYAPLDAGVIVGEEICIDGTHTFNASPSGGNGNYSYEWQQSTGDCSAPIWVAAVGATNSPMYTTPPLSDTTSYRVIVSDDGVCINDTSNCATVTVVNDPEITFQPQPTDTICEGGVVGILIEATGGTPFLQYQLQDSLPGGSWDSVTTVSGGTIFEFFIGSLATGEYFYRVIVSATGDGCVSDTSDLKQVVVVDDPEIVVHPDSSNLCLGETDTLRVVADGGTGVFSYQWQNSSSGTGSWSDISGANGDSLVVGPLTDNQFYRVQVTQSGQGCDAMTSAVAGVYSPRITGQPDGDEVCDQAEYTMIVETEPGMPGNPIDYSFQWQDSLPGGSWENVTDGTGANSNTFTTAPLESAEGEYHYRVIVSVDDPDCGDIISDEVVVNVVPDPTVVQQPDDIFVCVGGSDTLRIQGSDGTPALMYQWQDSVSGAMGWDTIQGATDTFFVTPALTETTFFRVLITADGLACDDAITGVATATVYDDPVIVDITPDSTICEGGDIDLIPVVTKDNPGPLMFQWQSSSSSSGPWTDLGTDSIQNAGTLTETTFFRVIVTQDENGCETISSPIEVEVVDDPNVTLQPIGASICEGGFHAMEIAAAGGTPELLYQWQDSSDSQGNWMDIEDSTGVTLITDTLFETTFYRVRVSAEGVGCATTFSDEVEVTVFDDPNITVQPANDTICENETTMLSVTAEGGTPNLVYQWYISSDGNSFTLISGATDDEYMTDPLLENTFYYVEVDAGGVGCDMVNSDTVLVFVNNVEGGEIEEDQTICEGETPDEITNVTLATGDGTITYQWQDSIDGENWTDIAGATGTAFQPPALTEDTWYRRVATSTISGVECETSSNEVRITVNNFTSANTISSDETICEDEISDLTGNAVSADGTVTYQWQDSTLTGTWEDISGATSQNYTTEPLEEDTWFRRIATTTLNSVECLDTSNVVRVTVNNLDPGTIDGDQTICEGDTPSLLTSTAEAFGDSDTTYQWQFSMDNENFSNVAQIGDPGDDTYGDAAQYQPPALTEDTWFRREVRSVLNGTECIEYSDTVLVLVNNLVPGEIGSDQEICEGGAPDEFTSEVDGSGDGDISYQWQDSIVGGAWTNIGGATDPTFQAGTLIEDTWFRRVATSTIMGDPVTCDAISNIIQVAVVDDPAVDVHPVGATVCEGGSHDMFIESSGGTPSLNYQWFESTDGINFDTIFGQMDSTITVGPLTQTTFYFIEVSSDGNGCETINSDTVEVEVVDDPEIVVHPDSSNLCLGETDTLRVVADGGTGVFSYQWQNSSSGTGSWSDISGANGDSLVVGPLTDNQFYRVQVTQSGQGCDAMTSAVAGVYSPRITGQPDGDEVCDQAEYTMIVETEPGMPGNPIDYSFQWQDSLPGGSWENVTDGTGANSNTFTTAPLESAEGEYHYRVIVSVDDPDCGDIISDEVVVNVVPDPTVVQQPDDIFVCVGGSDTLRIQGSDGTPALMYQWQDSVSGAMGWDTIQGATDTFFVTPALTETTFFRVLITADGLACDDAITGVATATVYDDPVIVDITPDSTICEGGDIDLIPVVTKDNPGPLMFQWQSSSSSSGPWTDLGTDSIQNAGTLTETTFFRVIVTQDENGCETISSPIEVEVVDDPNVTLQPIGASICEGGFHAMEIAAAGGTPELLYQWQDSSDSQGNWMDIEDSTGVTLITDTLFETTFYRVRVSAEGVGCATTFSDEVEVTVFDDPNITVQPANDTICENETTMLSVTAEGGTPNLVYQWYISSDGNSFTLISGATDDEYMTDPLLENTFYYVEVDAGGVGCDMVNSDTVLVFVNNVEGGEIEEDQTICEGETPDEITNVTLATGDGTITYQWQDSIDGENWTDIAGATGTAFQPPALTEDTWYRRVATSTISGVECETSSNEVRITVNNFTSANTISSDETICEDEISDLTGNAVSADGTVTYQWQDSTLTGTWEDISGATSQNYTTEPLEEDTWFRRIATTTLNSVECLDTSNVVRVTVNNLDPGTIDGDQTICEGDTPSLLTSTAEAFGDSDTTYQWQFSMDNENFSNVAQIGDPGDDTYGDAAQYQPPALTEDTWFRREVRSVLNGTECIEYSDTVLVLVNNLVPGEIGSDQEICEGGAPDEFTSEVDGSGDGDISYQWQDSIVGGAWTNIGGATDPTFQAGTLIEDTWFRRVATSTIMGDPVTCDAISNIIQVAVVDDPAVDVHPVGATVCEGGSHDMFIESSGGTPSLNYQWFESTDGINFDTIFGQMDSTITVGPLTQTTFYFIEVSSDGNGCETINSDTVEVEVVDDP
ncbi:MAG: hypothetical protein EA411_06395, partial [Saprospirales bacterium]